MKKRFKVLCLTMILFELIFLTSVAQALIEGKNNIQPPSLPKPVKGVFFKDYVYGTTVVRATNHTVDGTKNFARNDYSRRQAFNSDSSRFLAYDNNGSWHLYDANTFTRIKELPNLDGDAEPQWHPTNPNLLYYLPINGGMVVYELNVTDNSKRTVGNFTGRLPWANTAHCWTKSEGSPSADGRFWGFMAEDDDFNILGFFTWDLVNNRILGTYSTKERPDHVSMSPSGNYFVASWDESGTIAFTQDLKQQVRKLHYTSEHSDLALDKAGDDIYVSIDYNSDYGDVFMTNIRTGVRTTLFTTYDNHTATAIHFSGKAYDKPGWVLVSTYSDTDYSNRQWFHEKIFAVELKSNPSIYNLAHHHDIYNDYWSEPHASVNRDFTRINFNSNWETGSNLDIDTYMIRLENDDIPGGQPATPTSIVSTPTVSIKPTATPIRTATSVPTPTPTSTTYGDKLYGYIKADIYSSNPEINMNFKVEIIDTGDVTYTDEKGSFEFVPIPYDKVYKLNISKPNYLTRIITVSPSTPAGTKEAPVFIYPGDLIINGVQDNTINIADIMSIAKYFNKTSNDGDFNSQYDFNMDQAINMSDTIAIAKHFNTTSDSYM